MTQRLTHRGAMASITASALLTVAFFLRAAFDWGAQPAADFFIVYVYDAAMLLAAAACALRALRPGPGRLPWALIAGGTASQAIGNIVFDLVAGAGGIAPVPSPADVFWLAMMPLLGAGSVLVARERVQAPPTAGRWVDGLLSGFTLCALSAALVLELALQAAAEAVPAELVVSLAYPVLDVLMLASVVGTVALAGWRLDRQVAVVLLAGAFMAVVDSIYARQTALETYHPGGLLDAGWLVGSLLFAVAAWMHREAVRPAVPRPELSAPTVFGGLALIVLLAQSYGSHARMTITLAALALVVALLRMAVSLADNARLLAATRREAATDAITGLGNRRRLVADLQSRVQRPGTLTIFDLNGFKHYNDTFGHLAGDQLLHQIGAALDAAVAGSGSAYRMGGDEFCALVEPHGPSAAALADRMLQRGDGFSVTAAHGSCALPEEASTPEAALRLADRRMYACKHGGRPPADRQSLDVLLAVLEERSPALAQHSNQVARLARTTAERLGLDAAEAKRIHQAALLHDIGKLAIPESILAKPGPLAADEWAFVRQHTRIGERVLAAAPALARAADLVRCSHEHWDGRGYPDGLTGQQVPLGARVIAVCDAYDTMIGRRPHAAGRTPVGALAELRRCAGTQFDPRVVEVFSAVLADQEALGSPAGVPSS